MRNHQAYQDIQVSSDVLTASPHRQVQLLLEKCLGLMKFAQQAMVKSAFGDKHAAIGRANDILRYLRVCLNFKDEKTLDFARQLDVLYEFMTRTLVKANLKNDPLIIDQAYVALALIKDGWDGIA